MWRQRFLAMGVPCVALAIALFSASEGLAQHGGGGHGGGGHAGGGGNGGGGHAGGGDWHNGSSGWHGDYSGGRGYGGYGGYGYGSGLGWPGYWGGSSYGGYYGGYRYSNYPYTANYSDATQAGFAGEAGMPATQQNIAHVRVLVPAGAKISFNGMDTEQTGTERVFATPELQPGRSYIYEVRAQWMVGDKETTQTRQVTFHAGDGVTVNFM